MYVCQTFVCSLEISQKSQKESIESGMTFGYGEVLLVSGKL